MRAKMGMPALAVFALALLAASPAWAGYCGAARYGGVTLCGCCEEQDCHTCTKTVRCKVWEKKEIQCTRTVWERVCEDKVINCVRMQTLVKNNPGPALLTAAALGFLVARTFSRD